MARLPDPEIVCTRSQRSQADGRLEIEPVAEALPLIGFKVVVHVGSLFVEHYAVADDRLAVEDDIAMTQGNVDMTRRSPAAARFVVRPSENRKLPSKARASMPMVASRSCSPSVDQCARGCKLQPMCEMAYAFLSLRVAMYSESSCASLPPSIRVAKPRSTVSSMRSCR